PIIVEILHEPSNFCHVHRVHLENLLVCLTKLQIAQHLEVAAMILIFYNQNILEDTATSQLLTIT
ncbi:MAG TPA: hypothetical protein PLC27_05720, partial [Saprospiraceae bacterium]|nr:hypothetical protein [Saprospiraceae bacterium]